MNPLQLILIAAGGFLVYKYLVGKGYFGGEAEPSPTAPPGQEGGAGTPTPISPVPAPPSWAGAAPPIAALPIYQVPGGHPDYPPIPLPVMITLPAPASPAPPPTLGTIYQVAQEMAEMALTNSAFINRTNVTTVQGNFDQWNWIFERVRPGLPIPAWEQAVLDGSPRTQLMTATEYWTYRNIVGLTQGLAGLRRHMAHTTRATARGFERARKRYII